MSQYFGEKPVSEMTEEELILIQEDAERLAIQMRDKMNEMGFDQEDRLFIGLVAKPLLDKIDSHVKGLMTMRDELNLSSCTHSHSKYVAAVLWIMLFSQQQTIEICNRLGANRGK